jgi:pullulanase
MVALAFGAAILPGPGARANELAVANAPDLSEVRPLLPDAAAGQSVMVLHYHRPDGNYDGWNLWAWADGQDGRAVPFTGQTAFGRYAEVRFDDEVGHGNFIVRLNEWERKDIDHDRRVELGPDHAGEVWLISGDPTVYRDPSDLNFSLKARAAFLDDRDRVRLTLSQPIEVRELSVSDAQLQAGDEAIDVRRVTTAEGQRRGVARTIDLHLSRDVSPEALRQELTLNLPGLDPVSVAPRDVLNDDDLAALDVVLGPEYDSTSTTFRTWSPTAQRVELLLYESLDASTPAETVELSREGRGVWAATIAGDLHGTAYQYRFTHAPGHQAGPPVPDIHAFAATADSRRSLVVDLDQTDPEGFADHEPPKLRAAVDEIIYEIHVRDFSVADPNVPEAERGKYPGLVHVSPAEPGGRAVSTSLSHLKDLGVTAVHLLPIQDFGNERSDYNWGYWTSLFNVPEADYSTTPHDPAATIRQLKQTIQTLHEHDIRVILDVVYNHTSINNDPSPYEAAMPWHFFRTNDDGSMRNDAGTGNSVADERPMVRKFIVDSLKFWTDEYKIDGFRFDLVGTHQPETVRAIVKELRELRPDITLYGEPWTGGGPTYFPKGAQRGTTFAVFNDHYRNAIRGDLDGQGRGFVTGVQYRPDDLHRGIMGAIDDFADQPGESVNYVSAHDNRTFWDKLEHTFPNADDATKRKMQKLAHGMVLTAQGIPFIHGGADFCRTKGGNHNSYNAGDAVNKFDWDRKAEYLEVHDYIAGLIDLRKRHPAFRLTQASAVRRAIERLDTPRGVVGFTLDGRGANDPASRIVVLYNANPQTTEVKLPRGSWSVAVDAESSRVGGEQSASGTIELPGISMWVGVRD